MRDKPEELKDEIVKRKAYAFTESGFGSKEKRLQFRAQVDAYDLVLNLLKKIEGLEPVTAERL